MEKNDSKQARSFLRMILKEQGQRVDESLDINSWELTDLIIKNIHLVDLEVRNLKKASNQLKKEQEGRSQRVIEAIDAFFNTKREGSQ